MIARIDWECDVGEALPYLRHRADKGLSVPELDREPKLGAEAEWLYEAWTILQADRAIGMGAGPIPFAAIDRFAERYALSFDEFEGLLLSVRLIDSHVRAKASKPPPAPPAAGRSR